MGFASGRTAPYLLSLVLVPAFGSPTGGAPPCHRPVSHRSIPRRSVRHHPVHRRPTPHIRVSMLLYGGTRYRRIVVRPEGVSDHCALLWLPQSHQLLLDVGYNIGALRAAFRGAPATDFFHLTVTPFNTHAIGGITAVTQQVTVLAHHHLYLGTALTTSVRYGGLSGYIFAPALHPLFPGGQPVAMQVWWSCTSVMRLHVPRYTF